MRSIMTVKPNQRQDWKEICEAFAQKEGATLLFVNDSSMGLEYPSGMMKHIYIDELATILEGANK